jgi:hypothetical protein
MFMKEGKKMWDAYFPFTMYFNPQDESSTCLQNIGIQPSHYMAQPPSKLQILSSMLWKPQISHIDLI